jgi:hypothetical protein
MVKSRTDAIPSRATPSVARRKHSIQRWAWRIGIAVVVLAVAVGTVQAGRSHPARRSIPLPAAKAIGPGIGIDVSYADGSGGISCTAGFMVRTEDGQPGLLVAGHCNRPGGTGTVAIHYGGIYSYPRVGAFTESVFSGNGWDDFDIGLITLDNAGAIPLASDVDGHAVTGVAERVEVGDRLCHLGIRSGGPVCGPVIASEVNKVRFEAPGKCGDSGGPVYIVRDDGTVEAVGVFVAVSNGDDSEPDCTDPQRFSIAQRIQPWLGPWELTLVTTPPPT